MHPNNALVSSCHSHCDVPLWCSHTSFVSPLSYTPADTYLTLCIGHIVHCGCLCWFLLPLLILIFQTLFQLTSRPSPMMLPA